MKKPKKTKTEHTKCAYCKKAIHIDDLGLITYKGLYHKECAFRVLIMDSNNFLTGFEGKVKVKEKEDEK